MAPELSASPGAPSPMATPPTGPSPMAMPAQEGLKAQARVELARAAEALIKALSILKAELGSEEGKATVSALKAIQNVIPDVAEGLSQSALQNSMASVPGVKPAPQQGMPGMPPAPRPQVIAGARQMAR